MNPSKIAPCLWFDGGALDAARFYTSLFDGDEIRSVTRYGDGMPFPAGTPLLVEFTVAGQRFQALNGGPQFRFSEAISLAVRARDQVEVDRLWGVLTADGGRPSRCGWLVDRFGVSWQIVPEALDAMQASGDPVAVARMFEALLTMDRLDIAALERAFRGEG